MYSKIMNEQFNPPKRIGEVRGGGVHDDFYPINLLSLL